MIILYFSRHLREVKSPRGEVRRDEHATCRVGEGGEGGVSRIRRHLAVQEYLTGSKLSDEADMCQSISHREARNLGAISAYSHRPHPRHRRCNQTVSEVCAAGAGAEHNGAAATEPRVIRRHLELPDQLLGEPCTKQDTQGS